MPGTVLKHFTCMISRDQKSHWETGKFLGSDKTTDLDMGSSTLKIKHRISNYILTNKSTSTMEILTATGHRL